MGSPTLLELPTIRFSSHYFVVPIHSVWKFDDCREIAIALNDRQSKRDIA
jgi:hypothetical protein